MLTCYDHVFCVLGSSKTLHHLGVSPCPPSLLGCRLHFLTSWEYYSFCFAGGNSGLCAAHLNSVLWTRYRVFSGCRLIYHWLSLLLSRLILNSCCLSCVNRECHLGSWLNIQSSARLPPGLSGCASSCVRWAGSTGLGLQG